MSVRAPAQPTGGPRADPVLGFHGPDSAMWAVNREAVLLAAGPAALLLQVAHPLVAEGVAQHSRFHADPLARLRRTLATTLDLVFGDGPTAERAVARLNGIHAGVRGPVTGADARAVTGATAYRALDPALLLWVQATLVVTSARAYEAWVGPLPRAERERLWAEARAVGVRLGIPLSVSPVDWAALERYWATMLGPDGPVRVTATARGLAPAILRPPLPLAPGWLVDLLVAPGLALLPDEVREAFGIRWGRPRDGLARALGRGLRAWVRVVPPGWRAMPQARAADQRARRVAALRRPSPGASRAGGRAAHR
jgi:uncharacterized protein (DUF2236 family)